MMRKGISVKLRDIVRDKTGSSTPLTVALALCMLLMICAISEFFRLSIIVSGVRDGLQQAVISVAVTNYDEVYNGLREGYSGGYYLAGEHWNEQVDYADVYGYLGETLGTIRQGNYHVKVQGSGYEYRLSNLLVDIQNAQLAPSDASENFTADVRIAIEIPLSFGWERLPPMQLVIQTKAELL